MPATQPYIPRVSIVFDFDRTLATDTIDAFCATWGLERKEWQRQYCDRWANTGTTSSSAHGR